MKNIVGQAVSGKNFFERRRESKQLKHMLENGSHVLLSAPRRVGKTSLLYHLLESPPENTHCLYLITESLSSESEFYQRLHDAITEAQAASGMVFRWSQQAKEWLSQAAQQLKMIKIEGVAQIDLEASEEEVNFYERFLQQAQALVSVSEQNRFIIMIDEYPQMVENIIHAHGKEAACGLLQRQREFRQAPEYQNQIQFVYTGSIGLENVVSHLSMSKSINDLNGIHLGALSSKEAQKFMTELLKDTDYHWTDELVSEVIGRIEWCIPFYIQVFVQEVGFYLDQEDRDTLMSEDIEEVFDRMTAHRRYFEHWYQRLSQIFVDQEYEFVEELLGELSQQMVLSQESILNIAVKYEVLSAYKSIIQVLVHDGYLRMKEDQAVVFCSMLLQRWWRKNHGVFA